MSDLDLAIGIAIALALLVAYFGVRDLKRALDAPDPFVEDDEVAWLESCWSLPEFNR